MNNKLRCPHCYHPLMRLINGFRIKVIKDEVPQGHLQVKCHKCRQIINLMILKLIKELRTN